MWNRIMHVYIEARGYLSYSKRPCSLTPAFDKKIFLKSGRKKKKKEMGKALRIYGWENKIRFSSEPPLMGFFFLDSRTRHCSRLWTNIFSWCKYGVYSATDVIISFYGHTLIFFFEFKLMFHFRSTFHRLDVILFFLYKFLFLFFGASNLRRKCFFFFFNGTVALQNFCHVIPTGWECRTWIQERNPFPFDGKQMVLVVAGCNHLYAHVLVRMRIFNEMQSAIIKEEKKRNSFVFQHFFFLLVSFWLDFLRKKKTNRKLYYNVSFFYRCGMDGRFVGRPANRDDAHPKMREFPFQ